VEIHRVEPAEWERFRDVRLRALADAPSAFGSSLAREQAFDEAGWKERWFGRTAVFAAADGEAWLGIAGAYPDHDEPSRVWVVSMWVAPEARRRGAGRALIEACVDWARARDASEVRLWVTRSNAPARALYAAAGFLPTGSVQPLPSDPSIQEDEFSLRV
jgi:GNAT superfamily N-acetyltransferase